LIRDENQMINHRMNWFLILQGMMFVGISFAWNNVPAVSIVFGCVGILSCLSVGILLHYGILAIKRLEESQSNDDQAVIGRGADETSKFVHFLLPWHFLPVMLGVAWLALIIIRFSIIT
jgi:hypothetical protein